jgi:hypothetical protein
MSHLVIVGGSDAGISAALRSRERDEEELMQEREEENAMRPFGGLSVISFRMKKGHGKSDGYHN